MQFQKDQNVTALVRFSLSSEKWTSASYVEEAIIGSDADGNPVLGHMVKIKDGTLHYACRCLPLEKASDCLE